MPGGGFAEARRCGWAWLRDGWGPAAGVGCELGGRAEGGGRAGHGGSGRRSLVGANGWQVILKTVASRRPAGGAALRRRGTRARRVVGADAGCTDGKGEAIGCWN